MNYIVDFDSLPWQSPMPGVREKRCSVDGRALRLVEYSQSMAPHWCVKGHIGHIVDGVLELEFVERVITASTGDRLFIPGGSQHAHRAVPKTAKVTALFVEDVQTD
jgi:ethanolamine utilization protein EutQ (cupin superfamily)